MYCICGKCRVTCMKYIDISVFYGFTELLCFFCTQGEQLGFCSSVPHKTLFLSPTRERRIRRESTLITLSVFSFEASLNFSLSFKGSPKTSSSLLVARAARCASSSLLKMTPFSVTYPSIHRLSIQAKRAFLVVCIRLEIFVNVSFVKHSS